MKSLMKTSMILGLCLVLSACGKDDKKDQPQAGLAATSGWDFPASNGQGLVRFEELPDGIYSVEKVQALHIYDSPRAKLLSGFNLNADSLSPSGSTCTPDGDGKEAMKNRGLRGLMARSNFPAKAWIEGQDLVATKERFVQVNAMRRSGGEDCYAEVYTGGAESNLPSPSWLFVSDLTSESGKIYSLDIGGRFSFRAALVQQSAQKVVLFYEMEQESHRVIFAFSFIRSNLPQDGQLPSDLVPANIDEPAEEQPETDPVQEQDNYDYYYYHTPAQPEEDEEDEIPYEYEIELDDEEEEFARVGSGKGAVRDSNGEVRELKDIEEAKNYAVSNGFSQAAAEDMWKASASTGGVLSFAGDQSGLRQAILDHLAHMKQKMNSNTGDLDLVFVVDISGSMGDDIEAVINGLVEINRSLDRVVDSYRNVRVAIVTFGKPGREVVNLPFTSSRLTVESALNKILRDFRSGGSHSTDPGEACYHGMNCAATQLSWNARNKMAITITDEPSYEERTGDTATINTALRNLSSNGIDTSIYTIVTSY